MLTTSPAAHPVQWVAVVVHAVQVSLQVAQTPPLARYVPVGQVPVHVPALVRNGVADAEAQLVQAFEPPALQVAHVDVHGWQAVPSE